MDLRNYGIGAQILRDLNVGRMRLLAKPRKMPSMAGFDLEVTGYVELPPCARGGAERRARRAEARFDPRPSGHAHDRSRHRRRRPARGHRAVALQRRDRRRRCWPARCARSPRPAWRDDDIVVVTVPGALEAPLALQRLAQSGDYDALVALGAVIRGETYHFEIVANESAARRRPACSSSSAFRSATAS